MILTRPAGCWAPLSPSGLRPAGGQSLIVHIHCLSHLDLVQRRRTTNRLSDVRFSQGLARNHDDVEMIVPYVYRRDNVAKREIREHYGLDGSLRITSLPTPLWEDAPRFIRIPTWSAAVASAFAARQLRQRGGPSVWISRDHNAMLAILLAKRAARRAAGDPLVVYWAHELHSDDRRIAWLYRNADAVLMTNSAIQEDLHTRYGVPLERTDVTVNPVPPELFEKAPDRRKARRQLELDLDRPLVVYTGKLGIGFQEAEYILEAARLLPDYRFVFTGGSEEVAAYWRSRCRQMGVPNASFTGFLADWEDVRRYQMAADVLVSYYTSENKVFDYNYPQKITEYMASGTPLVTLEARATQDVLTSENAMFVEPHCPLALAATIDRVVGDPALGRSIAERAYRDARELTLDKWGAKTLAFLARLAGDVKSGQRARG
jgi:glycosyltransferase involved in cell wall biosynthesis